MSENAKLFKGIKDAYLKSKKNPSPEYSVEEAALLEGVELSAAHLAIAKMCEGLEISSSPIKVWENDGSNRAYVPTNLIDHLVEKLDNL